VEGARGSQLFTDPTNARGESKRLARFGIAEVHTGGPPTLAVGPCTHMAEKKGGSSAADTQPSSRLRTVGTNALKPLERGRPARGIRQGTQPAACLGGAFDGPTQPQESESRPPRMGRSANLCSTLLAGLAAPCWPQIFAQSQNCSGKRRPEVRIWVHS
jgi:hypothetical protein